MNSREDEALASAAVAALTGRLALTPQPGLPDPRDLNARATGRDHRALRWSAKALGPGLAAMAAAARRTGAPTPALRSELGAIGRCSEHTLTLTGGGHRGALWVLGLLVAATALDAGTPEPGESDASDGTARESGRAARDRRPRAQGITVLVRQIAAHPDRGAPARPSRGSAISVKYGAAGARGEARAGFPHVRRALDALARARAAGADETRARLDGLLTVMSTLQDTELLHTAGPIGLRHVQAGARAVLEAGGTATEAGAEALAALDADLHARAWSPRGSAGLLAGALFLDTLPVSLPAPAR
ncbi:triphosphoribosyl-dephospho-CoA synthase [Streptomyces sp. NPDC005728]|uniref:triphosphoribosyl-dephospho-CoA synthase n=1 Tax=Streptomyces sp. NPDC005728 TaxID=3157054 RepID=UPI0033C37C10